MTVGGGHYDSLGRDIAAGAGPVVDAKRLAEPLGQPLADQARGDVIPASSAKPTIIRTDRDG